jgi:hypothetical protein
VPSRWASSRNKLAQLRSRRRLPGRRRVDPASAAATALMSAHSRVAGSGITGAWYWLRRRQRTCQRTRRARGRVSRTGSGWSAGGWSPVPCSRSCPGAGEGDVGVPRPPGPDLVVIQPGLALGLPQALLAAPRWQSCAHCPPVMPRVQPHPKKLKVSLANHIFRRGNHRSPQLRDSTELSATPHRTPNIDT